MLDEVIAGGMVHHHVLYDTLNSAKLMETRKYEFFGLLYLACIGVLTLFLLDVNETLNNYLDFFLTIFNDNICSSIGKDVMSFLILHKFYNANLFNFTVLLYDEVNEGGISRDILR